VSARPARAYGVRRLVAATVGGLLVVASAAAGAGPARAAATPVVAEPTPSADPGQGALVVEDAQLRWGVNDETNNRAFAPGTVNFLSAGAVPDPGRGGQRIVAGDWQGTGTRAWRASVGDVRVEKLLDGTWTTATFAGTSTTTTGATMVGTNGPFSGHQVVLDGGTGTVDREAGTATVRWEGSFSVVFYSGMTFFTVTDPVLDVDGGAARLTAEVGGYASSMEDQSVWRRVPSQRVTLADLPRPDLGSSRGFTVTPRYRGVTHQAPADGTAQLRSGADWGAFPASFLRYLGRLGSASYWYSSGGSADPHKVPTPLSVSYRADRPVTPPTPGSGGSAGGGGDEGSAGTPQTPLGPEPPAPTDPGGDGTPGTGGGAGGQPGTGAVTPAPGDAGPVADAGAAAVLPAADPEVRYALQSSPASSARVIGSDHRWTWWLGSVLLLLAAATTVQTLHTRRTTPPAPPKGPR